jgi:hypothetical protein
VLHRVWSDRRMLTATLMVRGHHESGRTQVFSRCPIENESADLHMFAPEELRSRLVSYLNEIRIP